jgi:hypothetical protein
VVLDRVSDKAKRRAKEENIRSIDHSDHTRFAMVRFGTVDPDWSCVVDGDGERFALLATGD